MIYRVRRLRLRVPEFLVRRRVRRMRVILLGAADLAEI